MRLIAPNYDKPYDESQDTDGHTEREPCHDPN